MKSFLNSVFANLHNVRPHSVPNILLQIKLLSTEYDQNDMNYMS